jgi:hypothetical protein
VFFAIWASEYVLIRRITNLLLNEGEAAVFQIPILLKALFVGGKLLAQVYRSRTIVNS